MKKKEEKHKQTEDGAGSMPPASHAQQPGAGATPDHADADQDKALFAKMIKQYLGKDGADEEEMEMAKHAYQAHKEGGMSHEEAYEAAGKHLKMAMAIGKKMAQGKQSESEGECEDEKAHESEGDMEAEEAQSPPPNPKGDAKKESFQVAKLAGEVAKLRESVRSYEVREYLDDKMKKSGEPVSVTKKFREALGTPKSKEQIDATWKIFLSAFKAASEEVGDGMLFMEKSYRESGEKEGSSFLDCLR